MRIVERDPGHAIEIDTVFMLEHAADPKSGGLRIGADGRPFDLRCPWASALKMLGVVSDAMVLEPAGDRRRKQHVRLAVCFRLQERDDRELAAVILAVADHSLEAIVGGRRPAEIERNDGRAGLADLSAIVTG